MRLGSTLVVLATTVVTALTHSDSHEADPTVVSSNDSLLWGTYRPNLYFGMRPRLPASLMTGLIWFGAQDYQGFSSWFPFSFNFATLETAAQPLHPSTEARHACDQGDGLIYTYTEHDARTGGKEVIKDPLNNVELSISFLKVPGDSHGEPNYPSYREAKYFLSDSEPIPGGSWAVRIAGRPLRKGAKAKSSLGLCSKLTLTGSSRSNVTHLPHQLLW